MDETAKLRYDRRGSEGTLPPRPACRLTRRARQLIDLSQPIAILFVAILHFILDPEHPQQIVAGYQDAAAPGSWMAVSHVTSHGKPQLAASIRRLYTNRAADAQARPREEILRLFGGWTLTDPGLVYVPTWRPEPPGDVPAHPERLWFLAGVASKPTPHRRAAV